EIIRAFVLGRMRLQPGANVGNEMPAPILEVHLGDAARVSGAGIAMGAAATAHDGIQLAVEKYDIRNPDGTAGAYGGRKAGGYGAELASRANLGDAGVRAARIGAGWRRHLSTLKCGTR